MKRIQIQKHIGTGNGSTRGEVWFDINICDENGKYLGSPRGSSYDSIRTWKTEAGARRYATKKYDDTRFIIDSVLKV